MRVPFGMHRGGEVRDLDDGYLLWLASLPAFEVQSISEKRKHELREAVTAELQRRLDERPELVALMLETEQRVSGTMAARLH